MRSPYPPKRKDSAPETLMPAESRSRAATTADVPPPTLAVVGAVSEMATPATVTTSTATRAEASVSTEPVAVETPTDVPLVVPCWILITLVHNTQPDGDMVAMGTATTSMKVSIALRKTDTPDAQSNLSAKTAEMLSPNIADSAACGDAHSISGASGESDGLQDAIAAEIIAVLEKCSFRVNQRLLLRDLLATRVASPYLIAPPVAITAVPEALGPSVTVEPSGQQTQITSSTATPSNLSLSTPTTSQPIDASSQPPPAMVATSAASGKTKSNIFNNSVPPRRRPPIPTLSVMVSKNGSSTNTKPVTETIIPPKKLVFPLGRFSCARQGEIHCAIHAWAALSHENAVRHLETSALSHFVVTNHERYFVSQDSLGHVVYLSFDPPERESVRLGVYGTHPLDTVFSNQLQVLLDHRLIEFTAKAVSAVLLRNASLHSSYMSFLKQSGASRHLTVKFTLPRYIQDVYFYCTIVRQIFLNTQVLGRVTLGGGGGSAYALGGEKKAAAVKSAAELMHPSSFGYNLLNEGNILAGSRESSAPTSATSSPRQTLLKRPSSVHADDNNDSFSEPFAGRGPGRKSYAGAVTGGDAANLQGDISTPRKIFGNPILS